MYCTACGVEVIQGAKFCTSCGGAVAMAVPMAPPAPAVPMAAPVAPARTQGTTAGVQTFSTAGAVVLHFLTLGIFSVIHFNLVHGKLPRVRPDDPSAGRAIGFLFIPFYNLYWVFFTYRRLCLRVDEAREQHGLPPSNLKGLATAMCITMLIPYLSIVLCWMILGPIFFGMMRSSLNELAQAQARS